MRTLYEAFDVDIECDMCALEEACNFLNASK